MIYIKNIFFIIIIAILFCACANPLPPEGGPRDEVAPKVDSTESSGFMATNFDDDRIVLNFNEWVRLKDANQQIVISPPFDEKPEVKLKGKSLIIKFKEKLRPNTTYTINFGDAVEDITEGNKVANLRYIFSTGSYIDSLSIGGRVRDAYTGKAQEDVLVMLYDNMEDSIIYKEKPFYFTKTNSEGIFKINHLKGGQYKALALKDGNANYKFDMETEEVGFLEEDVMLTDSFDTKLDFLIFKEESPLRLTNARATQYGRVRFQLNQPTQKVRVQHLTEQRDFLAFAEINTDSVVYWFDTKDSLAEQQFVIIANRKLRDTTTLTMPSRKEFITAEPKLRLMLRSTSDSPSLGIGEDSKEKFEAAVLSDKIRDIHPTQPTTIEFNHPIFEVAGKNILLLEDSLKTPVSPTLEVVEDDRRRLILNYEWKKGISYELLIPSDALTDIYGLTNDTIRLSYQVKKTEEYGNLDLIIDSLESNKYYLIELLDKSGTKTLEKLSATGGQVFDYRFELLEPERHIVRVVEDDNQNGKWDSGNYLQRKKPEKIYIKTVSELRADWDVEVLMPLKEAPINRSNSGKPKQDKFPDTLPSDGKPKLKKGQ